MQYAYKQPIQDHVANDKQALDDAVFATVHEWKDAAIREGFRIVGDPSVSLQQRAQFDGEYIYMDCEDRNGPNFQLYVVGNVAKDDE